MADGERSPAPHCPRCGQVMNETPVWRSAMPLRTFLEIIPNGTHLDGLRHFECPDGHAGGFLMPDTGVRSGEVKRSDLMAN